MLVLAHPELAGASVSDKWLPHVAAGLAAHRNWSRLIEGGSVDVAMIATVTGVVGAICTLSIAFPQAYKVWRDRSSVGVSIVTWYLFCVYSFIWLGYSARVSNHLAFWTNFCTLMASIILVAGLRKFGARQLPSIVLWLGYPICATLAALMGYYGPIPIVTVFLMCLIVVRAPQIMRSWRTLRAASDSEVSFFTWWVSFGSGLFWGLHGIAQGDWVIATASLTGLAGTIAILLCEHGAAVRRNRARAKAAVLV